MSRHEGVSCDSCMRTNFRGKRYKCLVCYDYDLCENCYESNVFSGNRSSSLESNRSNHSSDHAMQCILTQLAYDLFYTGETGASPTLQSITCPICGSFGFTEATLITHVSQSHPSHAQEVVCPLCATLPSGDPNFVTEDYARHLSRVHSTARSSSAATITATTAEEERSGGSNVGISISRRRGATGGASNSSSGLFHSGRAILRRRNGGVLNLTSSASTATSVGGTMTGNNNATGNGSQITHSSTTTSSNLRESVVDPIAELLSQLSGVRRAGAAAGSRGSAEHQAVLNSTAGHLQQLQWQLQMERQHVSAARDHLSRIPRRNYPASSYSAQSSMNNAQGGGTDVTQSGASSIATTVLPVTSAAPLFAVDILNDSRFMLRNFNPDAGNFGATSSAEEDLNVRKSEEDEKAVIDSEREKISFVEDLTFALLQCDMDEPFVPLDVASEGDGKAEEPKEGAKNVKKELHKSEETPSNDSVL